MAGAALAACGGGGGGSPSSTVSYAGKVVDGYISGATVCIDLNSSLTCDPGEPATTTAADGSYSLQYQGTNPVGLPILAVVPSTAKDSDDNGKSLAEVGKAAYNLATPIASASGSSSVPVTPLTTLVTHQMMADTTARTFDAKSIEAAQQQVQRVIGTDKNLLAIAPTKDTEAELHKVGQVVAIVLGDMTRQAGDTSKTAQVQAGTSLIQQVLPQIVTAGKVDSAVASALGSSDKTQLVSNLKAALENTTGYSNVVSGTVSNIALNTKLPEQETPNAADTFKEGIVFLEPKRFHPDTGLPFPNDLGNYTDQKYIRLEFIQYLTDSKQFRKLERAWYQSNWTAVAQWGMDYGLTTSGNWVQDNGIAQSKNQATLNGNCIELAHASGIESAVTACFSKIPLAGKKITEFVPEACSQATALGGSAKASCATEVFAEGSYGLNMTTSEGRDYYFVSVPQRTSATDKHENYYCDQATADNIDALVDLMLGNTASDACRIYLWNSFSVKLKTYDKAKGTGTLQWQYWNGSEYIAQESGTFKVITVYNNRVLVIPPSQSYHRDNPGELAGQDFILAKAQGGIYTGTATYANTRKSATFGTSIQGNPKMIDSILNAMGISNKPPYEQAQNVTSAP